MEHSHFHAARPARIEGLFEAKTFFGCFDGLIYPPTPKEVLDGAYTVFEQVFVQHPLTGTKARALALVSLLWASRRLHGNNSCNEKYLLSALQTPTRLMNKAFSSLASVIRPEPGGDSA